MRTIGEVPLVSQGHAQPRGNPVLIGQACEHCDLRQRRLCLDGQQVGTGVDQSLDSGTVEGGELLVAEVIVAGVLGAVAQCRAVGSDGPGDEGITGPSRDLDATCDETQTLLGGDRCPLEPQGGRLVAGGRDDLGTGADEVGVHLGEGVGESRSRAADHSSWLRSMPRDSSAVPRPPSMTRGSPERTAAWSRWMKV